MKRQGVVLLLTLFLIIAIFGVVSLMLTSTQRLRAIADQIPDQAQAMRLVNDLQPLLNDHLSRVTTAKDLYKILLLPLSVSAKESDYRIKLSLQPVNTRLNINTCFDKNGTLLPSGEIFFSSLFTRYPVTDSSLFFNILSDTIDDDLASRGYQTEISIDNPSFTTGSFVSQQQWQMIVERYIALSKDKTILTIPWERLIMFEGQKIDINSVSGDLLVLLAPTVPPVMIQSVTTLKTEAYDTKEEVLAKIPQLETHYDRFFTTFTPQNPYPLLATLDVVRPGGHFTCRFFYDIASKRVSHLEIR